MKPILIILLTLLTANTLHAQQLNLKNGDEFAILTHSTETGIEKKKLVKDDAYTFQFKMIGGNAAGYKLQCTLLKIKQWGPEKMYQLNIDSIRQTIFNNSGLLTPLIVLQKPFTVIVNNKGKLIRLEGVTELARQVITSWHLNAEIQEQQKASLEAFLTTTLKNMFFELPEQKIAYQSTWTNGDTKTTYKVNTIRGALLDINTVTADKTAFGNFTLNETNGLLENSRTAYSQSNVPDAKRYTYDQTLKYGQNTAPAADTAWINMAALLSYWSDAFTNKATRPDSAKIVGYFKAHDGVYANDQYYINKKLDFYNGLRSASGNREYDNLLVKTPNSIIAGSTSHLFNKLQEVSRGDVDSTYNVISYFYKDPDFYDWLQNSFAQHFLNQNHLVADKLIEKLAADKKLNIQPMVVPLALWVAAKNSYKPDALINSYNSFMKMDDAYMKKGNGSRYALLIYQMLKNDIKHKEADKLLDRTIQNLERYNADTLNKSRFADRNMLAYAYYLKYKNISITDTVKALQYLAKASLYSPGGKNDRAHISFYDRAFLKSKESYRDDFINKLFAHGDSEEALKIFADQITADPQKIEDMQNTYQKHFPGKSFKDFFTDKVVNRWADAPAFELTDLNGKKQPLAGYKGQWLVMDFWGTWCGPCREEMPEVDKFSKELTAGKHKGINMLGVACYDTESKVRAYLTGNNYNMNVALSDNVIQKNYKISGYPSKILVSPNGKMIDIVFLADWQLIVKKFNELYAAN